MKDYSDQIGAVVPEEVAKLVLPIVQQAYQDGIDTGWMGAAAKISSSAFCVHKTSLAADLNIEDSVGALWAAAYAKGERAMREKAASEAERTIFFADGKSTPRKECAKAIRALPVEAAPATPSDEIAWLAEALIPPRDGNPGTVHWVNMEHGALGFTTDSYKALRFSRKEDVEAIATLYGFQGQNLKPVEHMWSGGPGAPSEAGSKK